MGFFRTVCSFVVVPTATSMAGIAAMIAETAGRRDGAELSAKLWCDAVLGTMGVDVLARVDEGLDPNRTYIFVSNHQSHVDVPVIIRTWPGPVRFVAKKSLSKIPIFGRTLKVLGHVFVDRERSAADRERLSRQVEPVRTSVSVLFFAEGTRSRDGDLLPFKKGCLALAEAAGVPVVPMAVSGTRHVLSPDQTWVEPGRVGVVIGAPMPHLSDPGRPKEERLSELRGAVEDLLREADGLRA